MLGMRILFSALVGWRHLRNLQHDAQRRQLCHLHHLPTCPGAHQKCTKGTHSPVAQSCQLRLTCSQSPRSIHCLCDQPSSIFYCFSSRSLNLSSSVVQSRTWQRPVRIFFSAPLRLSFVPLPGTWEPRHKPAVLVLRCILLVTGLFTISPKERKPVAAYSSH